MTTYVHSYLAEFLKWEMFQTEVVGKIKTNILYSVTFRNRAVNEITWKKYCTAGHAKDDSMAHAQCILEN